MIDREQLERCASAIAESGLPPLLVHAELAGPWGPDAAVRGPARRRLAQIPPPTWPRAPTRPNSEPIRLMIHLSRKYGVRNSHRASPTGAGSEVELNAARAEGLPITAEACPHHLHFAAEDVADGATLLKCTPPIRSRANREALWQGLRDGSIDLIATDHSPCPPEMERKSRSRPLRSRLGRDCGPLRRAASRVDGCRRGVAGFGTRRYRALDVRRACRRSPDSPERRSASLAPGREASFVVFDPGGEVHCDVRQAALPPPHLALLGRAPARSG